MRKFCLLCAFVTVTSAICLSTAQADEPKTTDNQAQATTKDPNYRFHNGQWWYWMPQQKNWKVWNGTAWSDFQPGQTNRSFSYTEGQAPLTENAGAGVTRLFGAPLQSVPYNVSETGQIIGSYGFRRASSKAVGNY